MIARKISTCIAGILFFSIATIAQTDSIKTTASDRPMNKKGKIIGPQQGEYAIGIDATPFLEYLGNMFKISEDMNEAPTFGFTAQNPGMIYFKYMKSDVTAYRLAFRIGVTSQTYKDGTGYDDSNIDKYKYSALNTGITFGFEKSPFMKSRLRGYYGGQATIGTAPYEGVSFITDQQIIGKYQFIDGTTDANNFIEKGGTTIEAGVGGFVGLEYFITTKIAIAGEFNLMLLYAYQTKRKYVPETGSEVTVDAGMSEIMFDNLASGSITLMCYF